MPKFRSRVGRCVRDPGKITAMTHDWVFRKTKTNKKQDRYKAGRSQGCKATSVLA